MMADGVGKSFWSLSRGDRTRYRASVLYGANSRRRRRMREGVDQLALIRIC
jgi:hypothetical protein